MKTLFTMVVLSLLSLSVYASNPSAQKANAHPAEHMNANTASVGAHPAVHPTNPCIGEIAKGCVKVMKDSSKLGLFEQKNGCKCETVK